MAHAQADQRGWFLQSCQTRHSASALLSSLLHTPVWIPKMRRLVFASGSGNSICIVWGGVRFGLLGGPGDQAGAHITSGAAAVHTSKRARAHAHTPHSSGTHTYTHKLIRHTHTHSLIRHTHTNTHTHSSGTRAHLSVDAPGANECWVERLDAVGGHDDLLCVSCVCGCGCKEGVIHTRVLFGRGALQAGR